MTQARETQGETAEHSLGQSIEMAVRLLEGARRVAVTSHVNPDADAIGSSLGLALGLRAMGKDAIVVLGEAVPEYARFLAGTDTIVSDFPEGPFDVYVFADAAGIDRVGDLYARDPGRFETAPIVNLDHHRTNPLFGTANCVDPGASSTSEMSFRLLQALKAPIEPDTASVLLFGIVGDTGSFRNGATTPGALRVAAELVALGGDIQRIAYQLFEYKTFAAARLWGRVVSTSDLDTERHMVFACLSQELFAEEGASPDEAEGIVEFLRGIHESRVVVLLKENAEGDIRVSMRSLPDIDVSAIASALGGGGHRQAAGCTLSGPFDAARREIIGAYDRLYPR